MSQRPCRSHHIPQLGGTGSGGGCPGRYAEPGKLGSEPQGAETGVNKDRGGALRGYSRRTKCQRCSAWQAGGFVQRKGVRDRLKGEFEPNGARLCGRCKSVRAPQQAWLSTLFGRLIQTRHSLSSTSLWSCGRDGQTRVSIKGSESIGAEEGARAQGGGSIDPLWVWASSPGRKTPGPRVSTWEALDSRRQ